MDEEETAAEVNIEEIMQEIRQQILARQTGLSRGGISIPTSGKRFSPEFYEHLYHATLAYNQIQVKTLVTPISIPVVGPVIQWIRYKLHELVLFYVNKLAEQQVAVNNHLLQAINILSQELEQEAKKDDQTNHLS